MYSQPITEPICQRHQPLHHVLYLKTHKTGSTTMYSIMAEFCRSHDLLALLPKGNHINLFNTFRPTQLLLSKGIQKYDMVMNHHIFDPKILDFLHNDTFLFTTIRDPLTQMISSFNYFKKYERHGYMVNIPEPEPLLKLVTDPEKYEGKGYVSFTNNRQSMDLGYDLKYGFDDVNYINKFVQGIDQRFNLVLISEFYDESLVLLKRHLGWSSSDILYFSKLRTGNTTANVSAEFRQKHKNHSKADSALYEHFLKVFRDKISKEPGFSAEVAEFKVVLNHVRSFCDVRNSSRQMVIPAGEWVDQVSIIKPKCSWLKKDETSFTAYLKNQQKIMFPG